MLLNASTRAAVVANALKDAFGNREAKIRADVLALTEDVYAEHMGPWLEQIKGLPESMLHRSDGMGVQFEDASYTHLYFGSYVRELDSTYKGGDGAKGRIEYRAWIGHAVQYGARHPYAKRFQKIMQQIGRLKDERRALRAKLEACVKAVRTVEKMLEQWPAAKKYVPAEAEAQPPPPPAIPGDLLTAEIKRAKAAA